MAINKSRGYKVFSVFNYTILIIVSLVCVAPLVHVLAVSFSGSAPANANIVGFVPLDFTLDAYGKTIGNDNFIRSLVVSFVRTGLGTGIGMSVLFLAAYSLSKDNRRFPGRSVYAWYFIVTMLFNGGLVPTYILVQRVGLINSIWALILPQMVNTWFLILLMNFFRGVPSDLEEAALMDGATHFRIMRSIYVPISLPAIATIGLFMMVWHWNSWFDGLIYITDSTKYPLATLLQTIIVQQDFTNLAVDPELLREISNRTVKAAQIFIGALPILMVYPFLQRYFIKGMVLGAVKG